MDIVKLHPSMVALENITISAAAVLLRASRSWRTTAAHNRRGHKT
jgi:hypothetical protein